MPMDLRRPVVRCMYCRLPMRHMLASHRQVCLEWDTVRCLALKPQVVLNPEASPGRQGLP